MRYFIGFLILLALFLAIQADVGLDAHRSLTMMFIIVAFILAIFMLPDDEPV